MTLDVYGHVFDEFDPGERIPAEDRIRRARDLSVSCPSGGEEGAAEEETPANPHSPSCLPRISFMISEGGTGDQRRPQAGKNPLQMSLFDQEIGDRA